MRGISNSSPLSTKRIVLLVIGPIGLMSVFLFQHFDAASFFAQREVSPNANFAINRAIRLLLNDAFMLMLVVGWFYDRSITKLALFVQIIDFFILLPIYLFFKLNWEGNSEISSPLLSQFHRLIVNPTLMILLFPAVYFQLITKKK